VVEGDLGLCELNGAPLRLGERRESRQGMRVVFEDIAKSLATPRSKRGAQQ
jgi:hypothetical protein